MANNINIIVSATDKASKVLSWVGSSITKWAKDNEKTFKSLSTYWWLALWAIWTWILKLANDASWLVEVREAFGRLAEGVGNSSDAILEALQKSSKGAVDNKSLMLSANKAMSLWVAKTTEEFSTLMDIARTKAKNMGITTQQAFDDIVTWLGRWSPLILDNLGITVNLTEAYELYAKQLGKTANELSDTEKKQALINKVVKEWQKEMEAMGDVAMTAAEKKQALIARLTNMKNILWEALLPVMNKVIDVMQPMIEKFQKFAEENPELVKNISLLSLWLAGLATAIGTIWLAIPMISAWFTLLTSPLWLVAWAVTLLWIAWATNFGGMQDKTQALLDTISPIFNDIWNIIQNTFGNIRQTVKDTRDKVTWSTGDMQTTVYEYFILLSEWLKISVWIIWGIIEWLVGIFGGIIVFIKWVFTNDWETAWEWVSMIFKGIRNWLLSILDSIFPWVKEKVNNLTGDIIKSFEGVWTKVQESIDKLKEFIGIKGGWYSVWEVASKAVGAVLPAAWIVNTVRRVFNASWWPVDAWWSYIVWERWPERFVPKTDWYIVPNNQLWGGVNVSINMWEVNVYSEADENRLVSKVRDALIREIELNKLWLAY